MKSKVHSPAFRQYDPIVYVVDDDISIRESLGDLFKSNSIEAEFFASSQALLDKADLDRIACVLLDIRLPGISGLEVQVQLDRIGSDIPVIIMTGHADVPTTIQAMKAGAVDFLQKPFTAQAILTAVAAAFKRSSDARDETDAKQAATYLASRLSRREREVMDLVVAGMLNKQIAHELGISEITVKLHRGNVMRKMQVHNVADLVRQAELLSTNKT